MTRPVDHNGLEGAIRERAGLSSPQEVTTSPSSCPRVAVNALSLQKPVWNTENLPWRITSDVAAAAATSGVVSPIITMIDRYPDTLKHPFSICEY